MPSSAAVYARISDDTEGRAAGVGRQTEDCLALAERLGWELSPLSPFIDNDISGLPLVWSCSSARRPGAFEGWSLIELVEAGMWNRTQVRRALLSPRSAGLVAQGRGRTGLGTFQAPLTPELQERVSTALTGRSRGNTVTFEQRRHVLAGFLVCGKCGKPIRMREMTPLTTEVVWL